MKRILKQKNQKKKTKILLSEVDKRDFRKKDMVQSDKVGHIFKLRRMKCISFLTSDVRFYIDIKKICQYFSFF